MLKKLISLYINKDAGNFDKIILLSFAINILFSIALIYDFSSDNQVVTENEFQLNSSPDSKNKKIKLDIYFEYKENENIEISESSSHLLKNKTSVEVFTTPLFGYPNYVRIEQQKILFDHSTLIFLNLLSLVLLVLYPFVLTVLNDKTFPVISEESFGSKKTLANIGIFFSVNLGLSFYAVFKVIKLVNNL